MRAVLPYRRLRLPPGRLRAGSGRRRLKIGGEPTCYLAELLRASSTSAGTLPLTALASKV